MAMAASQDSWVFPGSGKGAGLHITLPSRFGATPKHSLLVTSLLPAAEQLLRVGSKGQQQDWGWAAVRE